MKGYMDYLDESTNTVRSRDRFTRLMLVLSYLLIWAAGVIAFWFFTAGSDAMGYSLMFLWIILPVTTLLISWLIGRNNCWGRWKWAGSLGFGIMYMLGEYATFSMKNNISFDKVNPPEFSMILAGTGISLIGMGLGHLLGRRQKQEQA